MGKTPKKVRDVRVITEIRAREVHEGKVSKFGNGGAHIIFSNKYIGKEVIIIPIENDKGKK